ncbi:MAG: FAD-binding protein, partial [Nitrosospira sp.]
MIDPRSSDIIDQFADIIRAACGDKVPLRIRGGGSKDFYGDRMEGQNGRILDAAAYAGIVDYEPTELVVTVRTGTRLA